MINVPELPVALSQHLAQIRVAVYGSGGAPAHHLALLTHWGLYPHVISAGDILAGNLAEYDAVIFPGGGFAAMAGQLNPLGGKGMTTLRHWVEGGGSYLGSCAGSCHPLRMSAAYQTSYPDAASFQVCDVTPLNAASGAWGLDSPGTGRIRVEAEASPLFEGLEQAFDIIHYNGPLFPSIPGAAGRVIASTEAFTAFETSQGESPELTTLARAVVRGARISYQQAVGEGQVILFGSHPEFGASPLQLGFLPAVRLLANALGLVETRFEALSQPAPRLLSASFLLGLTEEVGTLERLLASATPLQDRLPPETPGFQGLSGAALWNAALSETQSILNSLKSWLAACPTGSLVRGLELLDAEPKPAQDVGFMGMYPGLQQAQELTRRALNAPWPAFTGAYNELGTHPYHLLVSSYLSACGLIAGTALQLSAFASLNDLSPFDFSL